MSTKPEEYGLMAEFVSANDLLVALLGKHGTSDVDQPTPRREQRPERRQQPSLLPRALLDVPLPPQQLDVRVAPDHAARGAGGVEQDRVEGRAVPPAGRLAGVPAHAAGV